jgi:hypothetical protein
MVYQRYYLMGLAQRAKVRLEAQPLALRFASRPERKVDLILRLRIGSRLHHKVASKLLLPRAAPNSGFVGRYVAEVDGREIRFAIDAHDAHAIWDPEALEWSDVYFKANGWPHASYDPRVRPIVNGNGILTAKRIALLRRLRDTPKDLDVVFVSNLRGGRMHNVRLFEELNELDRRVELLAVFPRGSDPAEDEVLAARLRASGIPQSTEQLQPEHLWHLLARARVVVLRSGMHLCIPWRMLDLLALGSCIAYDAPPIPQWPVALEPDVHYANIGIARPEYDPPEEAEYKKVRPAVEQLLGDEDRRKRLGAAAAAYFDTSAAPEAVAAYVLEGVRRSVR